MKKIISFFLIACLLIGVVAHCPISVFATEHESAVVANGTCGGNITWTLDDEGLLTLSGSGLMSTGAIPWERYSSSIKNVQIGYGITNIDTLSFFDCENLREVTIPKSVKEIGYGAFSMCASLTNITIPDGVTTIGDTAFLQCTNLSSITIPDSVVSIGMMAFDVCNNISDVYYTGTPAQWAEISIGDLNESLTNASVHFDEENGDSDSLVAQGYCGGEGDGTNLAWSLDDQGTLTITGTGKMYTSFVSPWESQGLTAAIKSVSMSEGITSIAYGAFSECTNVRNIEIPKTVTHIGEGAFSGTSLSEVVIPQNVVSIGNVAFGNNLNLARIEVSPNNTSFSSVDGVLFNYEKTVLVCFPAGKNITSYTPPKTVKKIADSAFYRATKLQEIQLHSGIETIGKHAFNSCSSLKTITIPNGVTSIEEYSFAYCDNLTSITTPDSVTSIGNFAFSSCSSLADVYYTGTEAEWEQVHIGEYNEDLHTANIHYGQTVQEPIAPPPATPTESTTATGNTVVPTQPTQSTTKPAQSATLPSTKPTLPANAPSTKPTQPATTPGTKPTQPVTKTKLCKVFTYSSAQEDGFWLELLNVDGTAYILDIDATLVTPYDKVQFTANGVIYSCGKHAVKYTGKGIESDSGTYYNLQELMNLLNVRYDYVAESQTLLFNAATSFKEDLVEDCEEIFDSGFSLEYLDDPVYYGAGALYNILGGELFSYILGSYQIDLREEVVANIMSMEDSAESLVDAANNADSFAKKAITVYKGVDSIAKGIEGYSDLLDCSATEWLDAYDKVSKGGNVFGFSDFLDIAQLAYDAQYAYSTYATAVEYGLLENSYVKDKHLKKATKNVYAYYDEETYVLADVFVDAVKTATNNMAEELAEEATKEAIKKVIKKGVGYNKSLVKLVKLFTDEALDMKDMTAAVEQTHICAMIQEAAIKKYNASTNPVTKKYCAILYARACQYAYSLYAFDPELKQDANDWNSRTQEAIETLVAYSDAELSRTVENGKLDMTHKGFVVVSSTKN